MQALTQSTHAIAIDVVTAGPVVWSASWIEFSGSTIEDPEANIQSDAGTVLLADPITDIIPSPTSGNQTQVKFISAYVSADTVVDIYFDQTNGIVELSTSLSAGDTLFYVDSRGWFVLDSSGNLKVKDATVAAAQSIRRNLLSGSTNGRPIAVAATATPGTLIHTAVTGTISIDEIWLWATNRTGAAATLTLEFGGTGTADRVLDAFSIPANSSSILVVQGLVLNNSLILRAFSGTANAINVAGFVNRIS